MRDFDGDCTKLASHRKTKLASGGTVKVKSGGEAVLPKSQGIADRLRDRRERILSQPAKPLTVEINVQEVIRPIIREMIERVVWGELLGKFPFMHEDRPQRLVVIESPFGHPTKVGMEENAAYARRCMLDSIGRGEAPYASHLLYTQCLDDLKTSERKQGMEAGFAWGRAAQHVAVYTDRGVSRGMLEGIKRHQAAGKTIEFRSIA